ncbi:MAG: hypothetical protein KJZ86_23720 [Caldilineaceae bacterium]|nr:hypothetical protein [Caldilineaceae bacterium]
MSKRFSPIVSFLLIFILVLSACGGGAEPTAEPVTSAPLAAVAVATPTVAPTAAPVAAAEMDLTAAVNDFMSTIPEGWMAVGSVDKLKEMMAASDMALIDVREASEYEAGHIAGAVNIPLRTLADNLDKIPTDKPVVVYCASGHRAAMALSSLGMLGYTNVKSFPASYKGWTEANEPVTTDVPAAMTYAVPEIGADLLAAVDGFLSTIAEGWYSVGTVEKLAEATDAGAVLIDVREVSEFADGAITGAVNIPIRTLIDNLDQIPTDKQVVLYCGSGHRAAISLAALQSLGYTNIRSFPPSYKGWAEAQAGVPAEIAEAMESDFAVVNAVDAALMEIPEGWLAVGSVDALTEMMANTDVALIDVREVSEYEDGHIAGAVNIPLRTLSQNLDKIPTDRPVVVYCASGFRAGMALSALDMLGYENVKAFPASYAGWTAADQPVTTDVPDAATYALPEIEPEMLAAVDEFLVNIAEGWYSVGAVEKMQGAMDAGAFLVDVREEAEYAKGYIGEAINLPLRSLAQHVDQIPTDKQVIVYCASGHRAALANAALHVMGYDNVRAFPASYNGWTAAGLPVTLP